MVFEYDPNKSHANFVKHGIDLEQAKELWKGPYVEFAAREEYENRFAIIGRLAGKLYTCIYTLRQDRVRLISCRRAQPKEVKLYEKSVKEA